MAIGGEPHVCLLITGNDPTAPNSEDRCSMRPLLHEKCEADADESAVGLTRLLPCPHLGKADSLHRTPQAFGMITAVEMFADHVVEGHLLGTDHVSQPDFI